MDSFKSFTFGTYLFLEIRPFSVLLWSSRLIIYIEVRIWIEGSYLKSAHLKAYQALLMSFCFAFTSCAFVICYSHVTFGFSFSPVSALSCHWFVYLFLISLPISTPLFTFFSRKVLQSVFMPYRAFFPVLVSCFSNLWLGFESDYGSFFLDAAFLFNYPSYRYWLLDFGLSLIKRMQNICTFILHVSIGSNNKTMLNRLMAKLSLHLFKRAKQNNMIMRQKYA